MKQGALFKTAKDIAFIAIMTALLIASQLALSAVQGIEAVTILFLSYCYTFGVRRGIVVANCFSLLRCLLFGFVPTVVLLYVIYYNLFAIVFGLIGHFTRKISEWKSLIVSVVCVAIMTVLFTLIDDLITPWILMYGPRGWRVYFYNSLITMAVQTVCAVVTTTLLFLPLRRAFETLSGKRKDETEMLAEDSDTIEKEIIK